MDKRSEKISTCSQDLMCTVRAGAPAPVLAINRPCARAYRLALLAVFLPDAFLIVLSIERHTVVVLTTALPRDTAALAFFNLLFLFLVYRGTCTSAPTARAWWYRWSCTCQGGASTLVHWRWTLGCSLLQSSVAKRLSPSTTGEQSRVVFFFCVVGRYRYSRVVFVCIVVYGDVLLGEGVVGSVWLCFTYFSGCCGVFLFIGGRRRAPTKKE